MSDYTYAASGSIRLTGAVSPSRIGRKYEHKFGVGSRPFVMSKAKKGKLERITIKKVNMVRCGSPTRCGVQPIFNYVDSTNEVWLEDELAWQGEAIPVAIAYWEKVKEDTTEALLNTEVVFETVLV
jgi:hypothetical protein